ncbi:MAG: substrate-binding domain-containing protein [Clostridiales bacterium]
MSKSKKFVSVVIAFLMLFSVLSMVGCKVEKDTEENKEDSHIKDKNSDIVIGLSLPTQQEERWVRDKEKMEEVAKEEGVTLKTQIANQDDAKQLNQCENLISQGVDILIIAPNEAKNFTSLSEKAHKDGIKVISYDRLLLDTEADLYVSFDNTKVGELQGQYLVEKAPKGNYVILSGDPGDNNAKMFKEGAMKHIQPLIDKGDIKVVSEQACVGWKPAEAQKHMENALTKSGNKIDGILAPNDGTANGCIQALAAQNLAGKIPITGQDAEKTGAQRIVEGTQSMTIYKDTRLLGEAAIKAAISIVKGEDVDAQEKIDNGKMDVPSNLVEPVIVTEDNIKEILVDSGYLKEEDVYK